MQFLKNHYEKIILSVCLILFVLSLVYLIHIIKDIQSKANAKLLTLPEVQPRYKSINFKVNEFDPFYVFKQGAFWLDRKKLNPNAKYFSDLVTPFPIAQCPLCKKYIARYYFMNDPHLCPFCEGKLPKPLEKPTGPGPGGVDSDGDKMSDAMEKKYGFDPKDPSDGVLDKDNDGFPNYYEVLEDTDPTDPKSHPALAKRLYVRGIKRTVLPIRLKKLQTDTGENKGDWFIQLELGKRKNTKYCKLNDVIDVDGEKYKIIDCVPKKEDVYDKKFKANVTKDMSEVTIQSMKTDEKVVLIADQTAYSPKEKAYFRDIATRKKYSRIIDQTLKLGDETTGVEEYKVLSIDSKEKVVQLMNIKTQAIIAVSSKRRFEYDSQRDGRRRRNNRRNGMPPGMPMPPPGIDPKLL